MRRIEEFDPKCIRCILTQNHFDLEIDCTNCKYYWERVAKGEIVHVEEVEENEEEE